MEALVTFHVDGLWGTIAFGEADAEGWMTCQVNLQVPGFEAHYACGIERRELEQLRDAIARLDQANGCEVVEEWSAMETGVAFRFQLNRLGQLMGSYELRSDSRGPSLTGNFRADQTHLRYWLSELDRAIDHAATR